MTTDTTPLLAYQEDRAEEAWQRVRHAEKRIQRVLLDLEAIGLRVDEVRVDTRNFANCSVEIFLAGAPR